MKLHKEIKWQKWWNPRPKQNTNEYMDSLSSQKIQYICKKVHQSASVGQCGRFVWPTWTWAKSAYGKKFVLINSQSHRFLLKWPDLPSYGKCGLCLDSCSCYCAFKGTLHFLKIGSFSNSPRVKQLSFTVFEYTQPICVSGVSTFSVA